MTNRLFSAWRAARLFAVGVLLLAAACHGAPAQPLVDLGMDAAAADLSIPLDLTTPPDLTGAMWADIRPPETCNMRTAGVTAMQALLRIDSYGGLQSGRNGVHELAEATLVYTSWVFNSAIVDTNNIHLAMNVASATDPAGLPMEIPLTPGQVIEVEAEYIPASSAGYTNHKGPAAVVHFSHSPCGYVVIAGTTYH